VLERGEERERALVLAGPPNEMGSQAIWGFRLFVARRDNATARARTRCLFRHRSCGQITQVEPHCAACGETLHSTDVDVEPGPGIAAAKDTEIRQIALSFAASP